MNSESNENGQEASGETREAFQDLGDALGKAWRAGAAEAKRTASESIPRAREEFARGVHDLAWGVSYLVTFGAELVREIAPDCVNAGWDEGAQAARSAASSVANSIREKTSPKEEDGSSDTAEADQPSGFSPA